MAPSTSDSFWDRFIHGKLFPFVGPKASAYTIEFMGTFFLVLTIGLNVIQKNPLAPVAIGSILMVMIFMGGHISGAHYNPAVTFGVRLTGRDHISTGSAVLYTLFQLIASTLASLVVYSLTEETFAPLPPSGDIKHIMGKIFFAEFLYTFALVSVMLNTATTKSQQSNSFFGLAIGFTVLSGAFSVGPLTGGAFNPAVVVGPTIIHSIVSKGTWKYFGVYIAAQYLAAFVAAIVFRMTNDKEYRKNTAMTHAKKDNTKDTLLHDDESM